MELVLHIEVSRVLSLIFWFCADHMVLTALNELQRQDRVRAERSERPRSTAGRVDGRELGYHQRGSAHPLHRQQGLEWSLEAARRLFYYFFRLLFSVNARFHFSLYRELRLESYIIAFGKHFVKLLVSFSYL